MLVLQSHPNLPAVATLQKLANELPVALSLLKSVSPQPDPHAPPTDHDAPPPSSPLLMAPLPVPPLLMLPLTAPPLQCC